MKFKICLIFLTISISICNGQLIRNGDMELGDNGVASVPSNWIIINGSPDHCSSKASSCTELSYKIPIASPQGGKWVRFFRLGTEPNNNHNEMFGQYLSSPLIIGKEYKVSFYAARSRGNSNTEPGYTEVLVGFSRGKPSEVGEFHTSAVKLPNENSWVYHSYYFIASDTFDFISFGDSYPEPVETTKAGYIDHVQIKDKFIKVNGNNSICLGENTKLTVINDINIRWATSLNPTEIISNETSLLVSPIISTTYLAYGTYDTAGFTVNVSEPPIINLGEDKTLCQGDIITLDASTENATYIWQNGSTNPTLDVTEDGLYIVKVNQNSCISIDSIIVNFNPNPEINLGQDTTLCSGDSLLIELPNTNRSYLWQDGSTNSTFIIDKAATYFVRVTENECSSTDFIKVSFRDLPNVEFGNDLTMCIGDTILLDATISDANYLWQDGSTDPTYNALKKGIYSVKVTKENCSKYEMVEVFTENCEIKIELPNAFTPNGDKINDFLTPISINGIESMKTIIINRGGEKVFETNNPLIGWSAAEVSSGSYYWVIKYIDRLGQKGELKGYITVLK